MRHQDFALRHKKLLDARPRIGDQACSRASRLEDASWRGETDAGHRLAVDVEHYPSRTVDAVMVSRSHMADPADVCRKRPADPPFPAEEELHLGREFGCAQKELLHTFFAVRQAVADKRQVAGHRGVGLHGMMCLWIESVVHRGDRKSTRLNSSHPSISYAVFCL